jgi:hypothetical protein
VIENLEARGGGEECPELPGHVGSDLNLHVVEIAEEAGFVESYCAEIVGGVAELEVYGGGEAVLAAVVADGGGFFEVIAHGFLDEGGGSVGEMSKMASGGAKAMACWMESNARGMLRSLARSAALPDAGSAMAMTGKAALL